MPQPPSDEDERPPVNTANDYGLGVGKNLDNHSTSLAGRGKFVRQTMPSLPTFRTRQEAFRYAAWLLVLTEAQQLPDEDGAHEFEEVLDAVQQT